MPHWPGGSTGIRLHRNHSSGGVGHQSRRQAAASVRGSVGVDVQAEQELQEATAQHPKCGSEQQQVQHPRPGRHPVEVALMGQCRQWAVNRASVSTAQGRSISPGPGRACQAAVQRADTPD
jgi:hypothetical protein